MVKILMVHGFGTNANIFEVQIAKIRALLPSHWEYHFIEGDLECGPAPGIPAVFPNQTYRCWFDVPNLKAIEAAHDCLEEVIEDEGPFDVAWGFSQGANIISSFLLHHTHHHPQDPVPFHSAIFMNSSLPYSATPTLGIDITPLLLTHQPIPLTLAATQTALSRTSGNHPSRAALLAEVRNAGAGTEGDAKPVLEMTKIAAQSALDQEATHGVTRARWEDFESRRWFVEVDKEVRIGIPTAHLVGKGDEMKGEGERLVELCEEKSRLFYLCAGGHEVPRAERDVRRVCQVVERIVERASLGF